MDSLKFSIISQLADLITSEKIIEEQEWRSICYAVPELNLVYDQNKNFILGRNCYEDDKDYFRGIDNILKETYEKGFDKFTKLFKRIIENKKLSNNIVKDNFMLYDLYSCGNEDYLNSNYIKFKRLLNILDLDIKLIEIDNEEYNFKLEVFHMSDDGSNSIDDLNIIEEFLGKNIPTVLNSYKQMLDNYASGNPESSIGMARATLEGFFFHYSGKSSKDDWFYGLTKIIQDPCKIENLKRNLVDDYTKNQKYPRFRAIYMFFKMLCTLGPHCGNENKDSDKPETVKAYMNDALMVIQFTRSIIYYGIKRASELYQ